MKRYIFKGKTIIMTKELADDLGINLAESPIFQSKKIEDNSGFTDVLFRHVGVNDDGDIVVRVYEVE